MLIAVLVTPLSALVVSVGVALPVLGFTLDARNRRERRRRAAATGARRLLDF